MTWATSRCSRTAMAARCSRWLTSTCLVISVRLLQLTFTCEQSGCRVIRHPEPSKIGYVPGDLTKTRGRLGARFSGAGHEYVRDSVGNAAANAAGDCRPRRCRPARVDQPRYRSKASTRNNPGAVADLGSTQSRQPRPAAAPQLGWDSNDFRP